MNLVFVGRPSSTLRRLVMLLFFGVLSACQVQNTGNGNGQPVLSLNSAGTGQGDDVSGTLQFASLSRIPVPGNRPYARRLYSDDIEPDIVANPDIDAVTGRELASLPPAERRRQSALPYAKRAVLYNSIIRKYAKANGMNYEFIRAVIFSESSFKVNAKGRAGEIGLMQIKPATARGIGFSGTNNQLYIPENNIKYGVMYLRKAKAKGDGTICGTILKYNAGLYARRMNPISARYCSKVKRLMRLARVSGTG